MISEKQTTICFFNSTKTWGGGEKWHYEMSVFLHKKNYNVVVFTNKNSELYKKISQTNIKVIPVKVGNLSFLNLFKIWKLRKIFKKENIETIVMNLSTDVKFAGFAAKLSKTKNIIYRRGSAIPLKDKILNRYIFKNIITNILANSEETKKTINQKNKNLFSEKKIQVIYNGIDLEKYDAINTESIYNRQNNEIIIGNAGRLEYQKNQKDLIYLAKELKSHNIEFKILIAGSGRLKTDLLDLSLKENVSEKIIFFDFVENIKSFMQAIDIFVLTSFWEGFGYVLVEAMACRKPIVAYNISSNPEIVENNKSGFLVEYPNVNEMTEKIIYLSKNQQIQSNFGINGRKIVENKFCFKKSSEEFEKYINSFL